MNERQECKWLGYTLNAVFNPLQHRSIAASLAASFTSRHEKAEVMNAWICELKFVDLAEVSLPTLGEHFSRAGIIVVCGTSQVRYSVSDMGYKGR